MELWIRTQNRENTVKIINGYGLKYNDKKTIIANYQPDFTDRYDGYYELLGTYETKERALEVLDEIQELINPKQIITTYEREIKECINKTTFDVVMTPKIDNIQLIEPTTLIYEMPID